MLPDQRLVLGAGDFVDDAEQVLVARLLHRFLDLARQLGGGRVAALRVAEDEGVIEADLAHQLAGGGVILLGLAGKADDDIGGDGDVRAGGADAADELEIFLRRVGAMHRLEDAVGAGLQREMDVLDELRQPGEGLDQIVPEADGMRRGEADALDALDLVDGLEQLHERAISPPSPEIRAARKDSRSGRAA